MKSRFWELSGPERDLLAEIMRLAPPYTEGKVFTELKRRVGESSGELGLSIQAAVRDEYIEI